MQHSALVGYWAMEGDANDDSGSANVHNGTNIGSPTFGTSYGKFKQGVTLNGSTDAISIVDHADLKPTGDWSFGCWFKTDYVGSFGRIFQSGSINSNWAGIFIRHIGGRIYVYVGDNTATDATGYIRTYTTTTYSDDNWHYLTVTQSPTGFAKIYIDGELQTSIVEDGTGSGSIVYKTTNYVRIGCENLSGANTRFNFVGELDDMFLLNGYALTAEEVSALYEKRHITQEVETSVLRNDSSLKAYWRFQGNSNDETTNNNDGTDTNITYNDSYGVFDNGALFNGTDSKIVLVQDNSLKPTGDFSISAWIKSDNIISYILCNSSNESGTLSGFMTFINSSGKPWMRVATNNSSNYKTIVFDKSVNDGEWHFIVFVYKHADLDCYCYVDDTEITSKTTTNTGTFTGIGYAGTTYARIGCRSDNSTNYQGFFADNMDDLALWHKALSPKEISELYGRTNHANRVYYDLPNLVAYYPLSGSSADASNNDHGGTDTDLIYTKDGKYGYGGSFNGTSSAITITDHADLKPTGDVSIGHWFRTTDTGLDLFQSYSANTAFAGIRTGISGIGYPFMWISNNVGRAGADYYYEATDDTFNDGEWHLFIGTRSGGTIKIYIDGDQVPSSSIGTCSTLAYATTNYIRIGCRTAAGTDQTFYDGKLSDVFMLNGTELSAKEIKRIYGLTKGKYI